MVRVPLNHRDRLQVELAEYRPENPTLPEAIALMLSVVKSVPRREPYVRRMLAASIGARIGEGELPSPSYAGTITHGVFDPSYDLTARRPIPRGERTPYFLLGSFPLISLSLDLQLRRQGWESFAAAAQTECEGNLAARRAHEGQFHALLEPFIEEGTPLYAFRSNGAGKIEYLLTIPINVRA